MSPFMGGGSGSSLNTFFLVLFWLMAIGGIGGYLAYRFAVATVLRKYLNALPEEHRDPPESLLWLGIVPGLPCLLNFFVFPMLASAYRKALDATNPGHTEDLRRLIAAAWLYPFLYLVIFVPFVFPALTPRQIDSRFEEYFYLALIFSDVAVLVYISNRLNELQKYFGPSKPQQQPDVHPRRGNPLKWISRD